MSIDKIRRCVRFLTTDGCQVEVVIDRAVTIEKTIKNVNVSTIHVEKKKKRVSVYLQNPNLSTESRNQNEVCFKYVFGTPVVFENVRKIREGTVVVVKNTEYSLPEKSSEEYEEKLKVLQYLLNQVERFGHVQGVRTQQAEDQLQAVLKQLQHEY